MVSGSHSGRPWVLGQEGQVYTDEVSLKSRQQAGRSAQDLSACSGRAVGERAQSGDGKRCDKERGTRQNFRVVIKLENPLEGLLKI